MKILTLERIKGAMLRISFDNGEVINLDRDTALTFGLCENREISPDELKKVSAASQLARAKSRALWYLSRGDCSEKGMRRKLMHAGFDEAVCLEVVLTLVRLGLINDDAYAKRLAQNLAQRNYSSRQILAKLYEKQIPADIARQAVQDTHIDAISAIEALITKKYAARMKEKTKRQSVFAALACKGFALEDIKTVMRKFDDDFYYED